MPLQVLARKTGIPITMSIVYMSLAHRLGVVCVPLNFPSHFLLKWQEHPQYVNYVVQQCYVSILITLPLFYGLYHSHL